MPIIIAQGGKNVNTYLISSPTTLCMYMPSTTKIKKDRVELLKALKNMVHDQIPDASDRADIRHLKVVEKELKKWIEELEDADEPLKDNT